MKAKVNCFGCGKEVEVLILYVENNDSIKDIRVLCKDCNGLSKEDNKNKKSKYNIRPKANKD